MFDSLFKIKINYYVFVALCVLIYISFPSLSMLSYVAIIISLHQFLLVFYSIGFVIPVRYLFGFMMCLQMFIGPVLAYNGLDDFQLSDNKMQIPQIDYFSYTIPAVICFILGLHVYSGKLKGEVIDLKKTVDYIDKHQNLSYIFIVMGFASSIISGFLPNSVVFIFFLFGGFKFVGAFMFVLSSNKAKALPIVVVFTSIILSSLVSAMFHDLIIWLIFLGSVVTIKNKPTMPIKIIAVFLFMILAAVIQLTKENYRKALGEQSQETGLSTFTNAYEENRGSNEYFDSRSLAKNNIRINQGYIVTHIMRTVPARLPFAGGEEMKQILEAAILPRILAPNKLNAGDGEIFMKYTGLVLNKRTSMALSSVGDAYINFGIIGGCIFMFSLGFLYNEVLKAFQRYSKYYPLLILFTPLVFYYPIRPDCELQTILGHLVKSVFLVFVIMQIWKNVFKININENSDPQFKPQIIPTTS